MCNCYKKEVGGYINPAVMYEPLGKLVGIDDCIVNEITKLWISNIITISSCCGHNQEEGYIQVQEKDVHKMLKLDYKIHPYRVDSFIPKFL